MSVRLVAESVFGNPGNRGQWGRKSLAALAWQVRKRMSGRPREMRLPNDVRFNAYPDCAVSSALVYADWPEYHELMQVRGMLRPGDAVLDVGAYVGHVSLLVADIAGPSNLFAFEPAPVAFERLSENWRQNGWSTGHLFQTAAGDRSGTAYLRAAQAPDP